MLLKPAKASTAIPMSDAREAKKRKQDIFNDRFDDIFRAIYALLEPLLPIHVQGVAPMLNLERGASWCTALSNIALQCSQYFTSVEIRPRIHKRICISARF